MGDIPLKDKTLPLYIMDFNTYIARVTNKKTAKTYTSLYNNHLISFDVNGKIDKSYIKDINEYILALNKSASTKKAIYSLLVNITTQEPLKKKWKTLQDQFDVLKLKEQKERMKMKADVLPNKREVIQFMNEQYKLEQYKSFIVNFLLLYYNVRNKDLVIEFVKTTKEATDQTKNYFIVRKNDIVYLRNAYKTADVYGTKKFTLKSKKLQEASTAVMDSEDPTLFNYEDTDHFTRNIGKLTFKNLNESDYTKIVLMSLDLSKHKDELKRISSRRGTSVDLLLSTYKLN